MSKRIQMQTGIQWYKSEDVEPRDMERMIQDMFWYRTIGDVSVRLEEPVTLSGRNVCGITICFTVEEDEYRARHDIKTQRLGLMHDTQAKIRKLMDSVK